MSLLSQFTQVQMPIGTLKEFAQNADSSAILALLKEKHKEYVKNKIDNHRKTAGYLSISSISGKQCLRKLFYELFDEYETNEVDDTDKDFILSFGHFIHDYVQEFFGEELSYVEQFMQDDELKICGSTDGYLTLFDSVFEIKSANLNTFDYVKSRKTAKRDHIHQAHLYGYLLKKLFNVDVKNICVIYFNKNQAQYLNAEGLIKRALEEAETTTNKDLSELKEKYINIESFIRDEDFWRNLVHIYYQPFDETIIATEIAKIEQFWSQIELKKAGEKYKIPNKISTKYICDSCQYRVTCREKGLK